MSSNKWKKYKFSEFVSINPFVKLIKDQEYSFIEMKDLNDNNKYVYPSSERIFSGGAKFQEGDTLFARITPCLENGKICQVRGLKNGFGIGSTEFLVFRGKEGISDTNFVFYLARWDKVRNFAEQNLIGTSGRQRVNYQVFDNLEINLPPLNIQHRITEILSIIDEKIELNRKMNATLEAMAQAIFKEWFVDFNFPGAEGEMVESELGMIPKGWKVGRLGEIMDITMGQSPPGESYNEIGEGVAFFQGKTDFSFRFPTNRLYTTDPKRFAKKFNTLVSVRAPVGAMNIASEDCCIGRGLAAIIEKDRRSTFTYYLIKNLSETFTSFEQNGTVFGSINKNELEGIKCIIPEENSISLFEKLCRPIDDEIYMFYQQSQTLTKVRENLLPRLMNGKIDLER